MISKILLLSFLLAICLQGHAQDCNQQRTCGDCISTPMCSWCADMNFNGTSRCSINTTGCNSVENPSGRVIDQTSSSDTNPININNINLELRVGQPQKFTVEVTALRNLPLDLYILMDLSSSMGRVLRSVQEVAGDITARIRNITNNVQLGFGSFNDKNLIPFTNPEVMIDSDTEQPYTFRHRVDFTTNTTVFQNVISGTIVTTNVDSSENTLEALAQVISCDSLLGWRSRNNTQVARLVLVLTDQGFHYAGEGKLAGILNPYRGECLLERMPGIEEIELLRFAAYDYPSVGQVVDLIRRQDINVIFTVEGNLVPTYQEMVSFTNGRATVSPLDVDGNGEEILNTIENEYRRLLREITLEVLDPSDQFTIEITPTCPDGSNLTADGTGCDDVQLDETARFEVSVTLNSCDGLLNGASRVLTLESRAFGTFTVTVTGRCNCGCEEDERPNALECSGNGVFSCGVCVCNEGYCGRNCSLIDNTGGTNTCPTGGAPFFNQMCSGRGECDCVCDCTVPGTFGEACECDDFSEQCKSSEDEVCSGPSRGTCCNQACICGSSPLGNPYRGNNTHSLCQCDPVEEVCLYEGELCNSRGQCECDRCSCFSEWSGQFCQIPRVARCGVEIDTACISECRKAGAREVCTPSAVCNRHRPTLFVNMEDINMNTEDAVEAFARRVLNSDFTLSGASVTCSIMIDDCINNYYILDNTTNIAIVVEREVVCPTVVLALPAYAIALISLAVLILLGILIIFIVKIIFIILDYIEVQRWQKEAREADFSKNSNPLYQSPEMQYTNVAYGKAI